MPFPARATGLVIAALTMGLFFGALFLVVPRADRVITSPTEELAMACANVRKAESARADLTNMIVHDLLIR